MTDIKSNVDYEPIKSPVTEGGGESVRNRKTEGKKKAEFKDWKEASDKLKKDKENRSLFKPDLEEEVDDQVAGIEPVTFSRLMAQAEPERCIIIWGTVALFLSSILTLAIPAVIGVIIDVISPTDGE